jgi:hypothetical protein
MRTALRLAGPALAAFSLACSSSPSASPPPGGSAEDAGPDTSSGVPDAASGGDDGGSTPGELSIDPFSSVAGSLHEHEPFIAISPQGHVAVSFLARLPTSGYTVGYRISVDGGDTWGPSTLFPEPPGDDIQANASVAAGDDGTLYMAWAAETKTAQGRSNLHVFCATAAPGSTSFAAPVEVSDPSFSASVYDQPRVMVTHAGVVNVGYLAVDASQIDSTIVMARSTDGGKTWTRSIAVGTGSYQSFRNETRFCRPAGSGRIYMVYVDSDVAGYFGDAAVALRSSDDDGATWSAPLEVTTDDDELTLDASANLGCVTSGSDVWIYYGLSSDQYVLSGSTFLEDYWEPDMSQVRLAHSADSGASIASRENVIDPAAGTSAMYPVLAGEGGSTLDLAYYAGRGPRDPQAELRRSRATDGASFAPSALVHAPLTLEIDRTVSQWVGDYIGAAFWNGALYLVYTDNASTTPHVAFYRTPALLPGTTDDPDAGPSDAGLEGGCYAAAPFHPLPWAPPTAFGQAACSAAQIGAYLACSGTGDCSSFRADATNAACLGCLETDVGAAAFGPFVTQAGDAGPTILETNYGGCQAHFDGQTNANNACFAAECGACSDFANPTQTGPTAECYYVSNDVGACSGYRQTTSCGDELYDPEGGAATCQNPSTFVALWCGGP